MENYENNSHHPKESSLKTSRIGKLNRLRSKTTAIALGVFMMLSLGLVAFDTPSKQQTYAVQGAKALTILSLERDQEEAGLLASVSTTERDRTQSEIDALKEANRIQNNKIKALQRQLVEAAQKLHEVKAHLFTKGDPVERARLAEICQELVEKERSNKEYADQLKQLEQEKEHYLGKIKKMESTIDALATMTDTQRETKEQAIITFQEQIDQIHKDHLQEREHVENAFADMQAQEKKLTEKIAETTSRIKNMEEELSWQYALLSEKEKEIACQANLFKTSEKNLNNQIQDLVAALEIGNMNHHSLKTELDVANATKTAEMHKRNALEDTLKKVKAKTNNNRRYAQRLRDAIAKEYADLQGLIGVYASSLDHLSNKEKKLASLVKEEKNTTGQLQKELKGAIAAIDAEQQRGLCLEEELHKNAQKVATLNEELTRHQELLAAKTQELDTQKYSAASLKDQLMEKNHQLSVQLEEKTAQVASKENALQELTISLSHERTRAKALKDGLEEALAASELKTEQYKRLEDELSNKSETLAAMEDRLYNTQQEMNQLQSLVKEVSQNFEQEKMRSHELHQALVAALEENEKSQTRMQDLQGLIENGAESLTFLQDRMDEKKRTIDDLEALIEETTQELALEKEKNNELQYELSHVISTKEQEYLKAKKLEKHLEDNEKQIAALISQVDDVSGRYEQERSRTLERENTLNKILADNQVTADEFETLKQEIEALRQERDQLAKKNAQHIKLILQQQRLMQKLSDDVNSQQQTLKGMEKVSQESISFANKPQERSASTYHTVQHGDTLRTLSVYYYGTPERWQEIYQANNQVLSAEDDDTIQEGLSLYIP